MMTNRSAARKIAVVLGFFLAVAEFYPLRNLLAALLIFSVVFAIAATVFAALFLTDQLAREGMARVGFWLAGVRLRHSAAASARHSNSFLRS